MKLLPPIVLQKIQNSFQLKPRSVLDELNDHVVGAGHRAAAETRAGV